MRLAHFHRGVSVAPFAGGGSEVFCHAGRSLQALDGMSANNTVPSAPPDWLSVGEYGAVYGLGRQTAYAQVRLYQLSGGREGMPCEQHGKQYRISRYEIERRLGGRITWPIPGYHTDPSPPEPEPDAPLTHRARRKRKPDDPDQPQLFVA